MKVKVIRKFTDKHTSKEHSVGEVFECDKERLEEIQKVSKRLVTVIEDKPASVQKGAGDEKKKGE